MRALLIVPLLITLNTNCCTSNKDNLSLNPLPVLIAREVKMQLKRSPEYF